VAETTGPSDEQVAEAVETLAGNMEGLFSKVRGKTPDPDTACISLLRSLRKVIHEFMEEFTQEELTTHVAWNLVSIAVAIDNALEVLAGDREPVPGDTVNIPGMGMAEVLSGENLGQFLRLIAKGMSPDVALRKIQSGEPLDDDEEPDDDTSPGGNPE
jgi:hypothetical protein